VWTLLYLDPDGKVISSYVGSQNKYEILDLSAKVSNLYGQRDFLDGVKSNINKDYTLAELKNILDISIDHEFAGKEVLAMSYLDKISTIQEEDIRRVMPEVSRMDLRYLGRIAPLTGTVSYAEMYVRRNSKEWVSWRISTERAVYGFLKKYKQNGDLVGYEGTLEIMKGIEGVKPRKIDNLYLDFYKQNDLNKYRDFAIYLTLWQRSIRYRRVSLTSCMISVVTSSHFSMTTRHRGKLPSGPCLPPSTIHTTGSTMIISSSS